MSRKHRNRSWRTQWEVDKETGVARHRPSVMAAVVGGGIVVDATRYAPGMVEVGIRRDATA